MNDGSFPYELVQAKDGNFYGTTDIGGVGDEGTAFEITPQGQYTVLHRFGADGVVNDGVEPRNLIQASDGFFYGLATGGGSAGTGVAYKMNTAGASHDPPQLRQCGQ